MRVCFCSLTYVCLPFISYIFILQKCVSTPKYANCLNPTRRKKAVKIASRVKFAVSISKCLTSFKANPIENLDIKCLSVNTRGLDKSIKRQWRLKYKQVITLTECVVLYGYHNSIKNKQALNVTLLLAKYHIFATSSCDGKLSFESFLLRLQNHLEILKQSYTAANKSRQFFSIYGNLL